MSPHEGDAKHDPDPQKLAAFVDGELDDRAAQRISAWLARNPEAQAEVDSQRRLSEFWQASAAEDLPADRWASTLQRIDRSIRTPSPRRGMVKRRAAWVYLALAVTATAASVAVVVSNWPPPDRLVQPAGPRQEEAYPVLSGEEITILSLNSRDPLHPVIGSLPINDPLVLVEPSDIKFESIEPDEGMRPRITGETGPFPMVIVPARSETDRTP